MQDDDVARGRRLYDTLEKLNESFDKSPSNDIGRKYQSSIYILLQERNTLISKAQLALYCRSSNLPIEVILHQAQRKPKEPGYVKLVCKNIPRGHQIGNIKSSLVNEVSKYSRQCVNRMTEISARYQTLDVEGLELDEELEILSNNDPKYKLLHSIRQLKIQGCYDLAKKSSPTQTIKYLPVGDMIHYKLPVYTPSSEGVNTELTDIEKLNWH